MAGVGRKARFLARTEGRNFLEEQKAKHEVYHDIDLIEATLNGCGIDIENAGTFHGLNANGKATSMLLNSSGRWRKYLPVMG